MKKINVKVNQTTREVGLTRQIVGNQLENLQDELVFSFTDKFVDGQARLEYEIDSNKYWVTLDKVNETYTLPLNSQITSQEEVFMQLVISVDNGIFKSNVFSLYFANSINATTEAPEQYPTWLDKANEKLNQMDNINITANKVDNVATITVTRKDKTKDTVKIEDGAKGTKGDKGDIGATGNGISSIEKVDSVGLKTNYKINFTDGTNFNYSVNDGKTPVKGTDYYTEQDKQEMVNGIVTDANSDFNVNVEAKTNEFNSNAEAKTNTFNSNASSKVGEYNINAKKELDSYNDNATAKLKAYNDNHTAKLEEYNNNSIVKTGNYNDNADKQVADFNTNVITKTSEYNENATTKYNAYNTNDETKLKEYNDNATAKLAEFNLTASSKLNFKEYAVLGDRVSNEEANDIISKKEEYKDTIIYFKQGEENIGYGFVTYFGQDLVVVFYNTGEITSNNGYYEKTITYSRSQIYDKLKGKLDKKKIELKGTELTQEEATEVIKFTEDPDYYKEYHNALLSFVNTNYDEVAKGFVVTGNEELLYTFDKNGLTKWTKTTKEVLSSKEIANNTKRIKTLETNIFDSGVASGENINIKDSALAEFQEIKSSINKAQETTKGYQLFDCVNQPFNSSSGSTKLSRIPTGIRATQTRTGTGSFFADMVLNSNKFEKGKTYTLSAEAKSSSNNISRILLEYSKENGANSESLGNSYGDSITFTYNPPADKPFILFTLYSSATGEVQAGTYIDYKNIVLLKGEKALPYEPYTGGIASPNPDYPQEINTIKENWETVSCGSNLVDKSNIYRDNGFYYIDGSWSISPYSTYRIIVKEEEYYVRNNTFGGVWCCFDENMNYIKGGNSVTDGSKGVVKTPKNAKYFCSAISKGDTRNIQINRGKVLLPYEPYQGISTPNDLKGNEFLPGDNIIKRFNVEDGKYWAYLEKNMDKIILNGSENWLYQDYHNHNIFYTLIKLAKKGNGILYSNYFNKNTNLTDNYNFTITFSGNLNIIYDSFNTVEQFKTWLSAHNTEVVYELADEFKEVIPIAPLDQMNMTYNPETNLFSSIGNIKIEAKYYREFATTIRNMQVDNGKLQEQLNDIEKRIVALENRPVVVNEPVEESVVNA